jgi:hypothetical protein
MKRILLVTILILALFTKAPTQEVRTSTSGVYRLHTQYNVSPTTKTLTDNDVINLFSVTVANNEVEVVRIIYNITVVNTATNDIQNHVGQVTAALAVGNTGVCATVISNHDEAIITSSGTLLDTWAATCAAGPVSPVTFTLQANTSLAATTTFNVRYAIYSMTEPVVTYL